MKNQRKNYFIKPGFQTKLTVIILLIVIIVANIVGGVIYGLLSGSFVIDQIAQAFEIENFRDLLLPVVLLAELLAIVIVAFIGIFVSHTMAGPVYRFEKVLEDLSNGELNSHFNLRGSDEFQELAASFNKLIDTLNSKIFEIKIHINHLTNLMNEINSPKSITNYDIDNIKTTLSKLNNTVNFFKMIEFNPNNNQTINVNHTNLNENNIYDNDLNENNTNIKFNENDLILDKKTNLTTNNETNKNINQNKTDKKIEADTQVKKKKKK